MGTGVELSTEVQFVPGVGYGRAREFSRLGVRTVGELIEYFPFRHELRPRSRPIGSLELGIVATVVGTLHRVRPRGRSSPVSISAEVVDGTGRCRVRWFHSPYLIDKLQPGQIVRLTGKVDVYRDRALLTNPELNIIDDGEDPLADDRDRYEPVYWGTGELPGRRIARIIGSILDRTTAGIRDFLPDALRTERQLPPRATAVARYHRPTCKDDIAVARRRLAYEELLLCQLAVQMQRRRLATGVRAEPIVVTGEIDRRIRRRFPFAFTPQQDQAVSEIRADLARPAPMNRLLQGDVGSGKTAVAVYAALAAVANRRQSAILAPTEVLASQHRAKIEQYLAGSRVRLGYLVGSTPPRRRGPLLAQLQGGQIDLIIGTHALLEQDVSFCNLGLVLIDEQHKFGVEQRALLRRKGLAPHTLVMTATPIPRTLAMTVFGDLDVSTIRGTLPGRKPPLTRLVPPDREADAWSFVRSRLARGQRAYVVYPLVEESDAFPLKAATVEVERLGSSVLAGYQVGLLHGRMSASEKADVMARFRDGRIQVLVSTTVIEVGVDVPEATVMVIQHAQRYGLSQLHQLRGRIGRRACRQAGGGAPSYCLLFAEAAGESSLEPCLPAGRRLEILCSTSDGFQIAEDDLRLRGPGELVGTRQHGLPALKVADLLDDLDLLQQARDDAAKLLAADADLSRPPHGPLREELFRRYGQTVALIDVA